VIVTVVALVAETVNIAGLPAGMEVGLAAIPTVGAAVEPLKLVPPHPEKSTGNNRPVAIKTKTLRTDVPKRAFATVVSFPHEGIRQARRPCKHTHTARSAFIGTAK
jgi:hypothetical protein